MTNANQTTTFSIILGVTRSYEREYFLTKTTKTQNKTTCEDFPRTFKTKEAAEAAMRKWAA
jgi:hypothetical protein